MCVFHPLQIRKLSQNEFFGNEELDDADSDTMVYVISVLDDDEDDAF